MGTFLSVDETHRVLYTRFEGVLTDEVLVSRYRQAQEWNAVHRYQSCISDFCEIASLKVTTQVVRQIAELPPVVPNEIRHTVVVVAPEDGVYGLARMFEVLGSRTRNTLYVVRTMAEAYRLVGVESLALRPVIKW